MADTAVQIGPVWTRTYGSGFGDVLARRLVRFGGALTTQFSTEKSLVPSIGRILYRLVDSNTGDRSVYEVVKTRPSSWGRGIFECAVGKMSVRDIKVSDRPTEEKRSPVCNFMVVAAESGARQPTLLPPQYECP